MKTATLAFNPIEENTYVVWDESGEAVVIDAGNSSDRADSQCGSTHRQQRACYRNKSALEPEH